MFSIIKRILRLSGKYRPRVIAGLIFNALKSCCAAFVFFAVLLVMLNIEHLTETVILQAFGIVALSVLGRFLFQYLSDVLMSASGYEIFREKRLEIGNQLKRAPMGYFTENNLGTVQTVLTTTISDLEGNCMLALTFLVGGFVQALAMTLMLGIFCWQIGFLALTGILAGILVLGQIKKRAGAHTEDMQNAQELLVGSALEYIKGISVLRIFGKGKEGKGKVDQAFENKCRSDIAVTISTAGIMKLYEAVFKITSCLLFLLSALLYLWGVITLPYCLLFIICAFLMFMELELMNDGAFLSKMLATQLDRLDFISDIPVLDGDGKDIVLKSYEIELKDVIFAYDSRPVLDGITLKIPQNSTCAIVGPSGSGKTTLCNMIARFWDVNSGSVKIGGHDVKEFTCDSLLSYVSMVFQKVYLFNDTIENNIKFGKPNATHAEVVEAAKRARCHDFIEALPQGYETMIGEAGSTLSGGEKQRISIARAILKDAPIVILDEATSSVDPENEKALLDAIFELTKNKTLISIAHRLSTVRTADQIIVIDQGHIVQKGTHKELAEKEGIYRTFFEVQGEIHQLEAMRCVAMKKQFPIISFEHASFQYEGQSQESLKDVKLIIKSGEFLVITGQSGCGKTTLTRCINNLIPRFFEGRLSGEVIVSGRSIKESDAGEAGKEIASIFQDPRSQFFTTNSSSEVAFACENYGIPHKEIVKRVNSAFQSLNMENLKDRDIFALSSGERQKVAFLAATTLNPQIYVLDEPSANLDIHTILQVRGILSALKAAGHTIIVSEHRLFYLYGLADRFLIMEDGQICEELTGEEMAELSAVQMHNRRLRPLNLDLIQIERKESICRSEVFLQIRNLSFSHKAMPELLHNISLEAYKGETIALIGENGCGKTTLGKILSGLIRCRQGAFYIDGKNVKQQKLSDYVYFVMQEADHQLYTDSVTEELRLGNKRIPSIDEKVSQILKMLHLENFKDCHPYALSGGQKQRLTIGAAMLSEKPIIVLDEPTSGLDWDNMCAVANAVNYMREAGKLVFIITHDLEFISLTASRALLLKEGIIKDDLQMTEQNNFKIVKNFMVEEGGE